MNEVRLVNGNVLRAKRANHSSNPGDDKWMIPMFQCLNHRKRRQYIYCKQSKILASTTRIKKTVGEWSRHGITVINETNKNKNKKKVDVVYNSRLDNNSSHNCYWCVYVSLTAQENDSNLKDCFIIVNDDGGEAILNTTIWLKQKWLCTMAMV